MAFLSYHVAKVARWSKIAGISSVIVFGLIALGLALIQSTLIEGRQYEISMGVLFCFWAALYLVPGILMYVFGRLLENGRFWAFTPIALLAALDIAKIFIVRFFGGFACYVILRIPTMFLMAFVINAVPDMRDHFRRWRRDRKPRGFTVILTAREHVAPPPPPARSIRARPPKKR